MYIGTVASSFHHLTPFDALNQRWLCSCALVHTTRDNDVYDYPCGDDAFDDGACAGDDYDAFDAFDDDGEGFKRGWNEADTW